MASRKIESEQPRLHGLVSSTHTALEKDYALGMEVEYSGGGVLIFSYLILIHQLDNFGGLRVAKLSRSSLIRVSSLAAALMARQ